MDVSHNTVKYHFPDKFDSEQTGSLDKILTKNGKLLLQALYEHPGLSHKELYECLDTSASSLSNLISKIEQITPKLLEVQKRGRNSYYSLSPAACDYVKQELIDNGTKKIRQFHSTLYTDTAFEQAFSALKDFQQASGNDWDLKLDELLNGNAVWVDPKLYGLFHTFSENIILIRKSGNIDVLKKIYDTVKQTILIKRIQNYLDKQLLSYYQLEALFNLETTNLQSAMELVDEIFYYLAKCDFKPISIPYINSSISSEEAYGLTKCLCQMKEEFDHLYQGRNKAQVVHDWKQKYQSDSILLFYIAEKCQNCRNRIL